MSYKYKRIFVPGHPTANADGWMKEHRYIAEKKLGRLLKSEEVVHHIDGDKFNNNSDNLMIFKTNADHAAFHKGCKAILDKDVYWCPDKNIDYIICPKCNENLMYKNSKTCSICQHISDRKVKDRPSYDELFKLIKNTTFVKIGKMYGVTDNTVRKWCKSYNLPYKKKDLEEFFKTA